MKSLRNIGLVVLSLAFLTVIIGGCQSGDVKQPVGSGAKGLTSDEKKAKKGDE